MGLPCSNQTAKTFLEALNVAHQQTVQVAVIVSTFTVACEMMFGARTTSPFIFASCVHAARATPNYGRRDTIRRLEPNFFFWVCMSGGALQPGPCVLFHLPAVGHSVQTKTHHIVEIATSTKQDDLGPFRVHLPAASADSRGHLRGIQHPEKRHSQIFGPSFPIVNKQLTSASSKL